MCQIYELWDENVAVNGEEVWSPLAQILGHENLNTTRQYTLRSQKQLGEGSDILSY
jgi:hypothetical protein